MLRTASVLVVEAVHISGVNEICGVQYSSVIYTWLVLIDVIRLGFLIVSVFVLPVGLAL